MAAQPMQGKSNGLIGVIHLPDAKIIFANQLRAVAALCVLIVHVLGVYWRFRDVVAAHIFAPVLQGPSAKSLAAITFDYFNFGPFGVALFFLVSGFVIPFSLSKTGRLRFLAARALRIYPTYIVCLVLSLAAIWLSARFWGMPFGWRFTQILHNALLVSNIAGVESIDMVNWSLAIEIKFYLIACILAASIRAGRVLPLIGTSIAVLTLVLWIAYRWPAPGHLIDLTFTTLHVDQVVHDLLFMPFMFIGTVFSYRIRGLISRATLLNASLVLFGIFILGWPHTALKPQFSTVPINYFYAMVVFAVAYKWRARFRPVKPLDWLASISYPMYALHAIFGYVGLRLLGLAGINYYLAVLIVSAVIVGLAYFVHKAVEVPTQNLGKRIMHGEAVPYVKAQTVS